MPALALDLTADSTQYNSEKTHTATATPFLLCERHVARHSWKRNVCMSNNHVLLPAGSLENTRDRAHPAAQWPTFVHSTCSPAE